MNLHQPELIKKYGSWVRVQVAFYDYIFSIGTNLGVPEWKEKAIQEISDGFADGRDLYERSVAGIEIAFVDAEHAWSKFVELSLK